MPMIDAEGCPIHVEVEGPDRAPVLMLSNSLGTTLHMWDAQVEPLTKHFRLVRYDRRGHGKSGVPKGPYTMERLGRDVLAVLDGLGIQKINWCGLSMGGMVGQWLGANAPQRIERLILSNTSCYFPDKTAWNDRIKFVREKGLAALAGPNMERWFTKGFRERSPETIARMVEMFVATPLEGYIGCGEAVRSPESSFRDRPQNVAMGFAGEPVPPRIGSGAAVSRKSQRSRAAAASASASRSQLSKRCTPRYSSEKS
jgi:3-oxoadipate enol-lactonase